MKPTANNPNQDITLQIMLTGQVIAKFVPPLYGQVLIPTPFSFKNVPRVEHHGARIINVIRKTFPFANVQWSDDRSEHFMVFRLLEDAQAETRLAVKLKAATIEAVIAMDRQR